MLSFICSYICSTNGEVVDTEGHDICKERERLDKQLGSTAKGPQYELLSISSLVLPPFQNVGRFNFVPSQTSLSSTKFIENNTNIYNTKRMHYQGILHGRLIETKFKLQMLVNFSIDLSKLESSIYDKA